MKKKLEQDYSVYDRLKKYMDRQTVGKNIIDLTLLKKAFQASCPPPSKPLYSRPVFSFYSWTVKSDYNLPKATLRYSYGIDEI